MAAEHIATKEASSDFYESDYVVDGSIEPAPSERRYNTLFALSAFKTAVTI